MHRALESRAFIAAILAMTGGAFLFHTHPFPDQRSSFVSLPSALRKLS